MSDAAHRASPQKSIRQPFMARRLPRDLRARGHETTAGRSDPSGSDRADWDPAVWKHMLDSEQLIALAEWADVADCDLETSYVCVFTERLWDEIEARPFSEQSEGALEDRVRRVVQAAAKALDRLAKGRDDGFAAPGASMDFAARLASRTPERPWRILRLHAERVGTRLHVTLGTVTDFVCHPTECYEPFPAGR